METVRKTASGSDNTNRDILRQTQVTRTSGETGLGMFCLYKTVLDILLQPSVGSMTARLTNCLERGRDVELLHLKFNCSLFHELYANVITYNITSNN